MTDVELLEKLDEKWKIEKKIKEGIQELKSYTERMIKNAYGLNICEERIEVLKFLEEKIKNERFERSLINYYIVMRELYSLWCKES